MNGDRPASTAETERLSRRIAELEAQLAQRDRQEDAFRTMYEQAVVGFYRTTPDGRALLANPALLRMLGFSSLEELRQRNLEQQGFGPSYPRSDFKERLERDGEVVGLEAMWIRRDGTPIFVRENCRAVRDASGRVEYYDGSAEDVTERKRAESALAESEERYRSLFDGITDAALVLFADRMESPSATYAEVNETACQRYGYTREEFLRLGPRDLVAPALHEILPRTLAQARAAESTVWESLHVTRDGRLIPVEMTTRSLMLGGRKAVLGIVRDITERKRAEEALRKSEAMFRAVVQNSHDGILFGDATGRIAYRSQSYNRINGYTDEERAGRNVFETIHPEDREALRHYWTQVLQHPGVPLPVEYRSLHKDGSWRWVETTTQNLLENASVQQIVASTRDITDRKRAEEERERLRGQLTQAQKMESVGRLAGGVAHDFNNMLAVIIGHTEIVMEQVDRESSLHADLQEVRRAAQRSADLTRQLLTFARKQTVAPKVLDLNASVEGTLKLLRRLIGEDIDLAWRPGAGPLPVKIDPSQIDQVLTNLCVNSRDAIAAVGGITIETRSVTVDAAYCAQHAGSLPGEYQMLAVNDTGCGMDKETLEHLFEPFFTTKAVGKGTGLGLATVYGIVRQNDGFIHVESKPGHGTTVTIHLPRPAEDGARVQMDVLAPAASRGHETILIVEDEPAILKMTERVLASLGYAALAAPTPGEALRLVNEHVGEIHLLVTDVVMPGMNGRVLRDRLLAVHPRLKCLFMSGYTAEAISPQGVLDEGVHFLQKPFSKPELAAKVREALLD